MSDWDVFVFEKEVCLEKEFSVHFALVGMGSVSKTKQKTKKTPQKQNEFPAVCIEPDINMPLLIKICF